MKKERPADNYYRSTAREIEAEYFRRGKKVRMPTSFEKTNEVYQNVIACIEKVRVNVDAIRIPHAARVEYFIKNNGG